MTYFGVGLVGGWASLYLTPAGGGTLMGGMNSMVRQGFGDDGNWKWDDISIKGVLFDTAIGGVTAGIGAKISSQITPFISKLTSNIGGKAIQQMATQGLAGSGTGFIMSTGASLLDGDDLETALGKGWGGFKGGLISGSIGGVGYGLRQAYKAGQNPWTGEKIHQHHSDPKFLGGADNQKTTRMGESRHKQLHKDLNEYLKNQTNDSGQNMRPQRNNPGSRIQETFTRAQRIEAVKQFYDNNRFKYFDARYDFYKNNGIKWKP